jgi:hypothetical protein
MVLYCCLMVMINCLVVDGPIDVARILTPVLWGLGLISVGVVPALALRVRRVPKRLAAGLVAVGLAAVVSVGVSRGVIVPWAPVATATDAACAALERAGLGEIRPDVSHSKTRDDEEHNNSGLFSYCAWTLGAPTGNAESEHVPFRLLNSLVWLYENDPIGSATAEYRTRHEGPARPRTLARIGDEAFAESGDWSKVTARHANVVISVEIYPASPQAASIAEGLVRRMAAGVKAS